MTSNNIWLSLEDVAVLTGELQETVRRKCKRGEYLSTFTKNGRFKVYSIKLLSLPLQFQNKYLNKTENNNAIYSEVKNNSKQQADKYLELIKLTEGMNHTEVKSFLASWNILNPEKSACYTSLYNAKKNYINNGANALISKKNQCGRKSTVEQKYYEYYKSLFLKEGAPSIHVCWLATLGFAKQECETLDVNSFPTERTFDRMLKRLLPEQAIYLARYGNAAWNKKYATYISRDYSNITAGSVWVSDHAQIDVAVKFNGTVCFPWVTVFRDIKTSKWLGWFLHAESPNSDHIFQSFYYGVKKYGLPEDIYLDNGKDYRCKDFAGGREQSVKVKHLAQKENSLMKNVGVNVHFALPYNAQTKPVERDFLKIKTFLSKGFVGYRGGKITERPEKLLSEIKDNKIMDFAVFKELFDDFIINFLNKNPSKGKILKGRCPDEVWAEEFKVKRAISSDALKLFCMRTSRPVKIGRNGVYDSQLQVTYWGEWMIAEKGRKVFIRRDINAYQEAWVFDAKTEEYLGKANIYQEVSFLATTNVEKAELKKALAVKNKEKKVLKEFIKAKYNPTNEEIISNIKCGLDSRDFDSNPEVIELSNTNMDKIVAAEKASNVQPAKYVTPIKPKCKLFLTESEKRRAMAQRAI